ncbi:phosphotransferase enzyme family protein [Nocardia rhamnosiphila]|uniref:Aminoglycoside phosphotransferase family protein n=1 Tax=Nocardia rhamnosiphila TaxID=426716 RepID=A0ABV2WSC0_9NOCA
MTLETTEEPISSILHLAGRTAGVDTTAAELLHYSENAIYRLPGGLVARISRPGQQAAAQREIRVARWLEDRDIATVQAVTGIEQPVEVENRAITFWRELPPHRPGTPLDVATALRRLHSLEPPTAFTLDPVDPFVRLETRIAAAEILDPADRQWMNEHLTQLRERWQQLPQGLPWCVIHGDAWLGNVVSDHHGRSILLDLERTSIGPPEWDLVHTAIKHHSFGWIAAGEYTRFCEIYGHDVSGWEGYALLRDIREFRMTTMAAQVATGDPAGRSQALHRLGCIRGEYGTRPWKSWKALQ